ncbi:MAG: DUF2723 domain-containing protein [Candidatus Binatia bacterium]
MTGENPPAHSSGHGDALAGALLGVALFGVYALGAARTIYVGDSGELVAAVHTLGIPHPSGYPLYVLLGKLFTLIVPIGSIAFRMSLFSAAAAAAACGGLFVLARRLGLGREAALLASLLLAFAPSFWSQANVQRAYALNALFVVAATGSALHWLRARTERSIAMAFFLCGLGSSNHTFMAIYGVALGVYMLWVDRAVMASPVAFVRRGMVIGGSFLVGLLPYAYLPLRSRMNPRLDWGNPETFQGFSDVVLREDFWERAWIESAADLLPITADYVHGLGTELAWLGLPLVAVGIWAGWRRGLPVALLLLVMVANLASMALHGSRSDIFIWHRYYIPSYVAAALLAGIGWDALAARLTRPLRAAALVLPVALLATGYRQFDRSEYRIAEDFAYAVLESLPPGAHLIATDDNVLFVLIYLHLVEGRRPDIHLILQGVGKTDLPPLRFDPDNEPLFFTHHPNWDLPSLEIVPVGVLYRASRRGQDWPAPTIPRREIAGEYDDRVPKDYLTQNLLGHFHYTLGFTYEHRDWPRARRQFALAAEAAPNNDVLFYNLGLVFARNGLYEEALTAFLRSDEINPRHIASLTRPRASKKIEQARAELERVAAIEAELAGISGPTTGADAAYHERLARLLEERGEPLAAHGHRLRAAELRPDSS